MFISEEAMLNQSCLLICSMSTDTISFQVNLCFTNLSMFTEIIILESKIVNLQIKSQILSFFKEVVHYKFSYKIWI